jgi:hypothetical protein
MRTCRTAEGADEYLIDADTWTASYCAQRLKRLYWITPSRPGWLWISPSREATIRTIGHIVASWRLVRLRLQYLLPYLTLRASRDILTQAIDQLDTLSRANYCENFLARKDTI